MNDFCTKRKIFTSIDAEETVKRCQRSAVGCVLTPELTEGPYYWNTSAMRQNIS